MPHACAQTPGQRYFPEGAFARDPRSDAFTNAWYSQHLKAMREPSLQCASSRPVYRFLWLRTFHHPIAIRVEARAGGMHLFAVELSGAGGYEPGEITRRMDRAMTADEARMFAAAIENAQVWAPDATKKDLGADGAQWVVEARHGRRYVLHDVWTPDHGGVRDLGLAFIALTGWTIPQDEIY